MKIKEKVKKLITLFNKMQFELAARNITSTPPIQYELDKNVKIVTMLKHSDINMYLIAIKSFMWHFGYGSVEVIDDGTLTQEDTKLLQHHVPNISIYKADKIETLNCPAYISWKRLFRIADLATESYVIQLDADTISLAPLIDIHDKVQANEGFLIGNDLWKQPVDVNFLHNIVKRWNHHHPQPKAEEIFKDIDFFKDGTKYLRGCAGFAGYPKHFATFNEIAYLSQQIEGRIGSLWHNWGSEQVESMCLISKTKNASVLPWPKYQNYMYPQTNESTKISSFVHFIGSTRYSDRKYSQLVREFLIKNKR